MIAPSSLRQALQTPLATHLREFLDRKEAIGRDFKYLQDLEYKLKRLFRECAWKLPRDVTGDGFEKWRAANKYSPKTHNEYLNAIKGFMNWMRKKDRCEGEPMRGVEKSNTSAHEKRQRRAISREQFNKLLEVAGPRLVIYLVAAYTGLLRKELEICWNGGTFAGKETGRRFT